MTDVEGKELSMAEREILLHPLVGGIILFSRNFESVPQLKQLIRSIRSTRPELLIAVDQEGGRVQRFRQGFSILPPLADFGDLYQIDVEQAKKNAQNSAALMAKELLNVGIDFSFTPVLDIDQQKNQIIANRSFGSSSNLVSDLALAYIEGMKQIGMPAIGKHFPGHGAVTADSHLELPIDNRDYAMLWDFDLAPYRRLHNQLAGIMAAHIVYPQVDTKPASFSPHWLKTVLREQIGFQGVIFSDDLNMAGASFGGNETNRVQAVLEAGCDMALLCNNRAGVIDVLDHLQYQFSSISQARLQAMRVH